MNYLTPLNNDRHEQLREEFLTFPTDVLVCFFMGLLGPAEWEQLGTSLLILPHISSTEFSIMGGWCMSWGAAGSECLAASLRNCWAAAKLGPLKLSVTALLPGEQQSFKYFWVPETIVLWNLLSPFSLHYTRWAAAHLLCARAYDVWSINYPIKQKTGLCLPKNQLQAKLNFVFL